MGVVFLAVLVLFTAAFLMFLLAYALWLLDYIATPRAIREEWYEPKRKRAA